MEKSKALELAWKIALIEALGSRNEEILPEHFMCGLLKLVELDREKITTLLSEDEEALPGVISEQKKLTEMLAALKIDTTRVRRSLRKKVPRGNLEEVKKVIRRSSESRQRFLEAEAMAEKKNNARLRTYDVLQALLQHPTPAMQSVLAVTEESIDSLPTPEDTPTLNQYGKNILKAIPKPEENPDGQQPQVRAVLDHLASPRPDPLILIADAPNLAGAVVRQTAAAHGDALSRPVIVLDPDMLAEADNGQSLRALLKTIFEEAHQAQSAILFLDQLDAPLQDNTAFREGFLALLEGKTPPLILGVSKTVFQACLEGVPALRRCQTMWLHALDGDEDVPLEL